jgi:hypothetical protein
MSRLCSPDRYSSTNCTPGRSVCDNCERMKYKLFCSKIYIYIFKIGGRAAGIATGYGLDGRPRGRSSIPGREKNFHFSISSRPALGPSQPTIQSVPGVKRPRRQANHSSPTSAEVKKTWVYIPTPHTSSWRSAYLVKFRKNFY